MHPDLGAMQANVSDGVLRIVAGEEDGIDLVCHLEAADNVGEDIQKDAGGFAHTESYSSDYEQHGPSSSSNAVLFFI